MIETLTDIVEQIADQAGIYGAHDGRSLQKENMPMLLDCRRDRAHLESRQNRASNRTGKGGMMITFDESRRFHPLRECIGKTIVGTVNTATHVALTFSDGTVLVFRLEDIAVKVSFQERVNP